MMYYHLDPFGIIFMLPAIVFSIWAQYRVRSAYRKYAQVGVRAGLTGADIARMMMRVEQIDDVAIEPIPGEMTDHYDPRSKRLRLSEGVYAGRSIAALGIAAHEAGHAIQHARRYAPMQLRQFIYPVSSLGSTLAFPLIFAGLIFSHSGLAVLLNVGIWLFAAAVAFTVVTLPVEFNASRRALSALAGSGYLSSDELSGARAVLNAAAMTYVAAAAVAILQLIRLLLIAQRRD